MKLSFDYTRSVGSVLGQFFTALRERRIVGVRGSDGRVHVPPAEFDPVTYEPLTEIVPVASVGTVVSWTWQPSRCEGQPLDRPFAWALIKLDGADTALLHAVDAGSSDAISTGARVHVHWADEPVGAITDIAYFAPRRRSRKPDRRRRRARSRDHAGDAEQSSRSSTPLRFRRARSCGRLEEGKLLGARTGKSGKVYFPAREADPATGQQLDRVHRAAGQGHGHHVRHHQHPVRRQRIKPPYVAAYVLLDGADIPFLHLVTEIDASEVRMGMRVEAVWKPREEWGLGIDNIDYFRPTGEPDADYDTYKHHQ